MKINFFSSDFVESQKIARKSSKTNLEHFDTWCCETQFSLIARIFLFLHHVKKTLFCLIFNGFFITQMYDILVVNKNYDGEGPDSISVCVGDLVEVLETGGSPDEPNAK
jgi:hypothetical protein